MSNSSDLETIRELAHRLWEARGRRDGHAIEDWLDAERQVKGAQQPDPVAEVAPQHSRQRKKNQKNVATRAPTVPLDDAVDASPELPKVGSRDAPGG
jgi:hypothetical protein